MKRLFRNLQWRVLIILIGLMVTLASRADPLAAMQVLREGGCGGTRPPAPPLHHVAALDQAAQQWATGRSFALAAQLSGYPSNGSTGLHIRGPDSSSVSLLKQSGCRVGDSAWHDVGIYRLGAETWIVLGTAYAPPVDASTLADRALRLVNDVRARGVKCGQRSFAPAPPLKLSHTLASVALGHAADMARHDYFEHEDLAGHSPADRVRAVGYREKLVGENIAYGPKSTEEVMQGWLDSPGHCENIMDPRFAEMGIGYAAGLATKHGLYWVQVLVAPKS
ncbi:MAG TPA: CAP domain-containing protein [Steroidobacteraceae bacterium]